MTVLQVFNKCYEIVGIAMNGCFGTIIMYQNGFVLSKCAQHSVNVSIEHSVTTSGINYTLFQTGRYLKVMHVTATDNRANILVPEWKHLNIVQHVHSPVKRYRLNNGKL